MLLDCCAVAVWEETRPEFTLCCCWLVGLTVFFPRGEGLTWSDTELNHGEGGIIFLCRVDIYGGLHQRAQMRVGVGLGLLLRVPACSFFLENLLTHGVRSGIWTYRLGIMVPFGILFWIGNRLCGIVASEWLHVDTLKLIQL